MSERGTILEDWPRENGEINIYDQTIREWKTAQTIQFLSELRQYLRNSNKELWVEVPVSANLEDASSEYGLHLPELENVADRIVLTAIDVKNPPRVERLANSLSSSRYILNFFIDSETPLARTYLLDSLKAAYGNGISNVGVYPHTALTDSLWGAFYIGYVYHFALGREELQELYDTGDYQSVISEYFALEEEEKEEKEQFREKAYVNIRDAETSYANVLANLEEAEQVDLDVTASEITLQYDLELLSEARRLFVEGNYEEAEKKGETAIVEFSTLGRSIENLVKEERIKRVTSGVTIIVVFLLIIAILRFRVKRKK